MDLVEHHHKETQQLNSGRTDIREALHSRDGDRPFFRILEGTQKLGRFEVLSDFENRRPRPELRKRFRHVLAHVVFGKADRLD